MLKMYTLCLNCTYFRADVYSTNAEVRHIHCGEPLPLSDSVAWMVPDPECSLVVGARTVAETVLLVTEFVINPNGKSEVCILHEYMQRVLKVRPVYNFFECGKFDLLHLSPEVTHLTLVMAGEVGAGH